MNCPYNIGTTLALNRTRGRGSIEMLRITEISEDDKTVTLRLDGKVTGTRVSELEELCLHYRDEKNKTIVLDFEGVSFMDSNGVKMLEKIKDERVKITSCSPFIRSLLHNLITSNIRRNS
jgi:anti-anti-sigma factor